MASSPLFVIPTHQRRTMQAIKLEILHMYRYEPQTKIISFYCIRSKCSKECYSVFKAASSALRKSSIKSLQLSTPTDSRISVSSMPSLTRSASGTEACVMRDGDSANDSTAPNDSARAKTCSWMKMREEPSEFNC